MILKRLKGCQQNGCGMNKTDRKNPRWQQAEINLLVHLYVNRNEHVSNITLHFKNRNIKAIKAKLVKLKLYKPEIYISQSPRHAYNSTAMENLAKVKDVTYPEVPYIIAQAMLCWQGQMIYKNHCCYLNGKRLIVTHAIELTNKMLKTAGKKQIGKPSLWC